MATRARHIIFGIVGAAAIMSLFLFGLGREAFLDYDEATYAEISRETLDSGTPLVLVYGGTRWFDKPPLYFWTAMLSGMIFDSPETAMRIASAIPALGAVAGAWLIALFLSHDKRIAWAASAVLATTAAFVDAGRQARTDAPVTAALTFAYYFFLRGLFGNPRWFLALGAATGTAVMIKGVIGLLIYPLMLIVAALYWRFGWLREKWFWAGQAIALLIALPWHAYMTVRFGSEFWRSYLLVHVFERYSSNLIGDDTSVITYLIHLVRFASPWFEILVCGAIALLAFRMRMSKSEWRGMLAALLPAVFLFAFFASAKTKIPFYLVPLYPFMAVFSVLGMQALWKRVDERSRRQIAALFVLLCIFGLWSAVEAGFHLDPNFNIEHRLAEDERAIGMTLKTLDQARPVYFTDPIYWETVRFYSGGRTLKSFDAETLPREPFYLVIPTYKAAYYPEYREFARTFRREYRGTYFTLFSSL